mmetsp:Transcript_10887/g.31480  ORF Transcript_10887/g.31480 Transcript_10887/m.31480 type:complete len:170 (+) Transcript_10887:128-637(+)
MSDFDTPQHFVCPLTMECMADPLCSKYGHNYERRAILEWLDAGKDTCPMTRKPLLPSMLIPNHSLRLKIKAWKAANEVDLLLMDLGLDDDDNAISQLAPASTRQISPASPAPTTAGQLDYASSLGLGNEEEIHEIRRQAKKESTKHQRRPAAPHKAFLLGGKSQTQRRS